MRKTIISVAMKGAHAKLKKLMVSEATRSAHVDNGTIVSVASRASRRKLENDSSIGGSKGRTWEKSTKMAVSVTKSKSHTKSMTEH